MGETSFKRGGKALCPLSITMSWTLPVNAPATLHPNSFNTRMGFWCEYCASMYQALHVDDISSKNIWAAK